MCRSFDLFASLAGIRAVPPCFLARNLGLKVGPAESSCFYLISRVLDQESWFFFVVYPVKDLFLDNI